MISRKHFLPIILYSTPVIFFLISYFLIITSGEDIYQGASTPVNIVGDMIAAFRHSVRLADMFAWSIINFFDYVFFFGIDTIFRLIDVACALSIFYMATYITLGRRPRLRLPDASIFCAIFLGVFLTSNGLTLYAGFSKIHNYLFICFFTLLFGIFYIRDLWGRPAPTAKLFTPAMLVLGFLFGFASNVTAIVFLLALICFGIYRFISAPKTRIKDLKTFLFSWRFAGVLGIIISIVVMYGIGSGLGDYNTDPAYVAALDFLPFEEIFTSPLSSLIRILKHNIYNFAHFFFPFVLVLVPCFLYGLKYRPNFSNLKKEKDFLIASTFFIILHIIAMSQIYYPTRLVLPAYLFALSVFFYILRKIFKIKLSMLKALSVVLAIIAISLTVVRFYFAFSYVKKVTPVLNNIKTSPESEICVSKEAVFSKSLPYIHLGQEEFLVDWALPQTIYNKTVFICD